MSLSTLALRAVETWDGHGLSVLLLLLLCCTAQIFVGVSLLVSMDILTLVVYGQLMKIRWLINPESQVRTACAPCLQ